MPQSLALLEPKGLPAPGDPTSLGVGPGPDTGFKLFGGDGLTFDDLLDTVNPLHHLPVVGFIYRAVTGDTISPASRITGGALFGGPLGLAASVADTMLKETSGRDAGGHLLSLVQGKDAAEPLPLIKPDADNDADWERAGPLRHDAHEFEDWRPLAQAPENQVAATTKAPDRTSPTAAATGLRHDDNDTATVQSETETASPAKDAAAAGITPGPDLGLRKARPAVTNGPVAGTAAMQPDAQAGVRSGFPSPRVLAANPTMVTALRKGESPYFRPGGTLNSGTWLKLMNNTGANRSGGTPPTGAGGLSSATIAKALAKYGAAAQHPVPKTDK